MRADINVEQPSIGRLFDVVAAAHADRDALLSGAQGLSYRSLNQRANQFARVLKRRNVLPGDLVPVLAGRSVPTLVAFLGVLKAGAAYVPLDPGDPVERLRTQLADCTPNIVLVDEGSVRVSVVPEMPALAFGEAMAAARGESDEALDDHARPGDIACVMYTSGSSGRPKGIMVPHRAISRLVRQQGYAPFGPTETMLHLAPLAFDASTFEIWGALLNGGRSAIVTARQPSLDDIADAIRRHEVSTAWVTAGLFPLLVDNRPEDARKQRPGKSTLT